MLSDLNTTRPVRVLAVLIATYFTVCTYGLIRPAFEELDMLDSIQLFAISLFHLIGIYIFICEMFQGKVE